MLEQVRDYFHKDTHPTGDRLVAFPGAYEGESPIVVWIDTNDYYDESSGDVESPTGWFGRAGKWLILHDDRGFVSGTKLATEDEAKRQYEILESAYSNWADEGDADNDYPACEVCGRVASDISIAEHYRCPKHPLGGLYDELRQAERDLS